MGKITDLTGQQYGHLTVLSYYGKDRSNKAMWLCRCDYGTEKIVRSNDFKSGKITSCGCAKKKMLSDMMKKRAEEKRNNPTYRKNLKGKKFGRLTVIEFDEEATKEKRQTSPTQKNSWWKCQCDCGNIVSVASTSLTSGQTQSCGCLKREKAAITMKEKVQPLGAAACFKDLSGQVFGKLTVLYRSDNKCSGRIKWICKCECGNIVEVNGQSLSRGFTSSCGCLGNSKGQDKIRSILLQNNIPFQQEIKFADLKDKGYLRFDFAILDSDNKIIKLIEYDGRQHTDPTSIWHTESVIRHDRLKTEYCKERGIPLLRIPYTDLEKIDLDYLLQGL